MDALDGLAREHLPNPNEVPTACLGPAADRAAHRWKGAAVAFGRRADGVVTATVLGVTGAGPTEAAALWDLERVLRTGSFAGEEAAPGHGPPAAGPAPVYRCDGRYFGFVLGGALFDAAGSYRGWVDLGQVWAAGGRYVGELSDAGLVLRDALATRPADRPPPPRPQAPAALPRWPDRPPARVGRGYVDALDALGG